MVSGNIRVQVLKTPIHRKRNIKIICYFKQLKQKKMEKTNVTGKVIGGILIGTVIGAALGILFAPMDGTKTRNKIATGAKGMADDLVKKIKSTTDKIKSKAEEIGDMAEEKATNMKNNVGQRQNF